MWKNFFKANLWKNFSKIHGLICFSNFLAINKSYTLKWVICPKREIIINKFDRMNGMPKFWWWGISPYSPPPGSAIAHHENYLQTKAKMGEYTITIKKIY